MIETSKVIKFLKEKGEDCKGSTPSNFTIRKILCIKCPMLTTVVNFGEMYNLKGERATKYYKCELDILKSTMFGTDEVSNKELLDKLLREKLREMVYENKIKGN